MVPLLRVQPSDHFRVAPYLPPTYDRDPQDGLNGMCPAHLIAPAPDDSLHVAEVAEPHSAAGSGGGSSMLAMRGRTAALGASDTSLPPPRGSARGTPASEEQPPPSPYPGRRDQSFLLALSSKFSSAAWRPVVRAGGFDTVDEEGEDGVVAACT